jgi:hypothetical protein
LCRYHRVETQGAWNDTRTAPIAVAWARAQGRIWIVDHVGTTTY